MTPDVNTADQVVMERSPRELVFDLEEAARWAGIDNPAIESVERIRESLLSYITSLEQQVSECRCASKEVPPVDVFCRRSGKKGVRCPNNAEVEVVEFRRYFGVEKGPYWIPVCLHHAPPDTETRPLRQEIREAIAESPAVSETTDKEPA